MSIKRIGVGPRMSAAVIHGNVVYLAGQVPNKTADAGVQEQTAEVLAIIDAILAQAGTEKSKILSASIFLPNIADFAEMNIAWEAWASKGNTPARATIEARLANPKYKVEISVIAAI